MRLYLGVLLNKDINQYTYLIYKTFLDEHIISRTITLTFLFQEQRKRFILSFRTLKDKIVPYEKLMKPDTSV